MTTESRKPRDVRGTMLPLRFKIIDQRPPVAGALAAAQAAAGAGAKKGASGGKEADDEEVRRGRGGQAPASAGRSP